MTVKEMVKMTNTHPSASLISPPCVAKYMAMGMVAVFPGILPATIRVAPNSPMARAKDSAVAAAIPGQAKGTETRQKTFHSETPKVLAAFKIFGSICSKAPLEVLYIRGKATTVAARTAAYQENIKKRLSQHRNSRKKP